MATGWKWPCHFWARAFPCLSKSLWFCFPLPQRTLRHHVETGGEPWDGWSDYMGQNAALNYTRPAEKARNKLCVLKDWDLRVLGDWNTTWPILTSTRDYVWWVVYKEGPPLNHICQNSHLCTVPWLWLWVGPVNSLLTSKMEWNWTWLPKSGLKKLHGFCLGFLGISFGTSQLAFKKSEYLRTPSCEKVLTRYVESLCEKREYCLTSSTHYSWLSWGTSHGREEAILDYWAQSMTWEDSSCWHFSDCNYMGGPNENHTARPHQCAGLEGITMNGYFKSLHKEPSQLLSWSPVKNQLLIAPINHWATP